MTVRDLLKMGCGSKDKMFFWNDAQRLQCRDWQDYFLRNAFPYEPGTRLSTTISILICAAASWSALRAAP